jgi:hypothetical protein
MTDLGFKSLAREPDATTDWSRFKFYAPLIKTLEFTWDPSNPRTTCLIKDDLFRMLAGSDLQKPVLPNLGNLTWQNSNSRIDSYMDLFLGPQLTSLTFWFCHHEASRSAVAQVSALSKQSLPNLNSITVQSTDFSPPSDLTRALSDFICGRRDIKLVSTNLLLNRDAVRHVAASSCTYFDILNNATNLIQSIAGSVPAPFRELRLLSVNCRSITDLIGLVELLHLKNLRDLCVYLSRRDSEANSNLERMIEAINTKCSHTEFTSFVIKRLHEVDFSVCSSHSLGTLTPLLNFRNMTRVDIDTPFAFDLDDGDIIQMATAWPRLKELHLYTASHDSHARSRVTLASMVTLANHCPALCTFALTIHVPSVDFNLLPPEGTMPPNERVIYISFDHSTVADCVDLADIAKFMSRLFPKLAYIRDDDIASETGVDVWDSVSAHLQAAS